MDQDGKTIRNRAFAGLFFLLIVMGGIIFFVSGTIAYWQAWIYLIVFGGSSLGITLYLIKKDTALLQRRLKAGATAEKEKGQKLIQFLAQLAFIGLLAVPALDHRLGWAVVPAWFVPIADLFIVAGFGIVFFVFRENTFTSAVIETTENQRVVSTGPYASVRHPMYSGALFVIVFTPLALGSCRGLVFAALMTAIIIWRLLDEEKYLSVNLPGYSEYCKKTRYRLIPGVW